ncbi:MAG: DEAD/DEAH box helicase, partial [Ktedonobacteraceae bacterium]
MHLTPSQAFEHIKESMVEYLETQYKIAHPAIFAERGEILRRRGVVAQAPFIEATPAFPIAHKLAELEALHPQIIPTGLAALVQHGVPVDRFPLYTHQEEALLTAFGDQPNLLVATGTGSGKTESFMLPILADILREASHWESVTDQERPGRFEPPAQWLHNRRHERRPAAMRGIILYPMNALVNDQLSRLRRILSRGASPEWQKQHLKGNVIHFGMYTGLSQPTGNWAAKPIRDRFAVYLEKLRQDWEMLRDDLRDTGTWPRPDSTEMLCRWDMQAAPPDILVTNYSMLEYMLIRPIEAKIFELTQHWLESTPNARFTLVLDEAHTYTGAKGTEVAYLVRRLKERLGLPSGSPKFRAIATTASVPPGADDQLLEFTSDLFGEPASRFKLIRIGNAAHVVPVRHPSEKALHAFERFHEKFSLSEPMPAIEHLASDLELGTVDTRDEPQVALYNLLEQNNDIHWVRQRTARRATLLDKLSDACWQGLGTAEEQMQATAGILTAGSYARASALPDTPPLLSMRVHAFFRGVYGIWACMDLHCPVAPPPSSSVTPRPVGKLYMDPRPWCECGARVLELFSCRHCGLLYLGGIPDSAQGSLWPWSDDLSGSREDIQQFQIFGVEAPNRYTTNEFRSTRTTLNTHPHESYARPVYPVEPAKENNVQVSQFPQQCPRCRNWREFGIGGREVIEPLRTKGPRTFSIIAEDGFRVQPRAADGSLPNYGRKALLFTDSRQDAAQLAADLRDDHHNDIFRQLVYRVLMSCPDCAGTGKIEKEEPYIIGQERQTQLTPCVTCIGTGKHPHPKPLTFEEVRMKVIELQLQRGINPTNGHLHEYFARMKEGDVACYKQAEIAFHVGLRRELSQREFALEPLGLAYWRFKLPEQIGAFAPLTEPETHLFLQAVTRILATENVLLPPQPFAPWEWPEKMVKDYERSLLIWGYKKNNSEGRQAIPYNLQNKRKLGCYVIAVSQALVALGRLSNSAEAEKWVHNLTKPLWEALRGLKILTGAGKKIGDDVPYGIRIDGFELQPTGETVHRCNACAYIMNDALFNVCLRCGQQTSPVSVLSINNYYRRAAMHALPNSLFDDPYPLRSAEHTAQIASLKARDEERWFQDMFHDHQNPDDYRIDVLSVTTTMEMGMDIGSLLSVGMRNVPPTVANYQQRAGRAGRRGSSLATVLTFAQFRSHDQYYFARPPEIVSDPPRVPALYLNNEVIARRHVRSLILQDFFSQ